MIKSRGWKIARKLYKKSLIISDWQWQRERLQSWWDDDDETRWVTNWKIWWWWEWWMMIEIEIEL